MKVRGTLATVGLAMVSAIGGASAAPTMSVTNLPIDDQLLNALAAQGKTQAQIDAFLTTLSHIKVYDDHKNPAADQVRDRSKAKIFYAAPYFTSSPTRSVVGAEQFADHAIELLDDADDLLSSFNLLAKEYQRLQRLRKDIQEKINGVDTALAANPDPVKRASLEALRPILVAELGTVEQQILALANDGSTGLSQLGLALRHDIASAFVLQMSRLGLTPTPIEQAQISSDTPSRMVVGLASLRSRAGEGQFGLRQYVFEAGFNVEQRNALQTYLALRPDVTTRSLAVQTVSVRPTAQTLIDQSGRYLTRNAVMQIRGVNLGNQGRCGSAQTCNVVVEYTDLGARSGRFLGSVADTTPIMVPVTFEASVRVAEPDFVGSIFCNFKTGWVAQGRADVKDGAIIYDGDLSNKIKYDSIDSGFGGCQMTITEGDRDSAFFHALQDIDETYRRIHTERQQAAKREKDAYRAQIEAELQWQQQHSQSRSRGGWFSDVFGLVTGGRFLLGFAGFLIGETRDFYWHTTTLDTHNIDEINVRQSYNIHGLTATRTFSFDGYPMVCYTPQSSGSRVIKACPEAQLTNGDTEAGAGEDTCSERDIFGDCVADQG